MAWLNRSFLISLGVALSAGCLGLALSLPVRADIAPEALDPDIVTEGGGSDINSILSSIQTQAESVTAQAGSALQQFGSLLQVLQDPQQAIGSIVGQLSGYLDQLGGLADQIKEQFLDALDGGSNSVLDGVLQDAIGALGLPDTLAVLQNLSDKLTNGEYEDNPVNQLNPAIQRQVQQTSANVAASRLETASVLSQDNQLAMAQGLQSLQDQVMAAAESQLQGNAEMAESSALVMRDTQGLTQMSVDLAVGSQSRVSTQDVLKDLATLSSYQTTVLYGGLMQNASQSVQLSNITAQQTLGLQIDSAQLLRQQQTVTGLAVANQNLADMNERLQGEQQAEIIQQSAVATRQIQVNQFGFGLAR